MRHHSLRSIVLVPARAEALAHAMASGASAVAADLTAGEDPLEHRRAAVAAWLSRPGAQAPRPALHVQVHGLRDVECEGDLDALFPHPPDGIMLPQCGSGEDLQRLGVKLGVREAEHGRPEGAVGIAAMAAGTAADVLALPTLADATPRLRGLLWDSEALMRSLGLLPADRDRAEPAPLAHARALMILVARAAGIGAFDVLHEIDDDGLARRCAENRRHGFSGALTRVPRQVPIIEAAYGGAVRTP